MLAKEDIALEERLTAAEAELSAMLKTVLDGPLAPLRQELAGLLKEIRGSMAKMNGVFDDIDNKAAKIHKKIGDVQDITDGRSDSLAAEQADIMQQLEDRATHLQGLLAALQSDTAKGLEAAQRLEASLERSMAAQADRLTAALIPQLTLIRRLGMACAAGIRPMLLPIFSAQ